MYSQRPDIRLRPVPEMGQCFAYDPARPALYVLNSTTWLILLLCATGAARDTIADRYHAEVEPLLTRQQAGQHADAAIAELLALRLIEPDMDRRTAA